MQYKKKLPYIQLVFNKIMVVPYYVKDFEDMLCLYNPRGIYDYYFRTLKKTFSKDFIINNINLYVEEENVAEELIKTIKED